MQDFLEFLNLLQSLELLLDLLNPLLVLGNELGVVSHLWAFQVERLGVFSLSVCGPPVRVLLPHVIAAYDRVELLGIHLPFEFLEV